MTRYNLSNICTLLTKGFSDEELRRLCFEITDFRPVYDQLAQGVGKVEVVLQLVEYAERQMLLKKLLALARVLNRKRYEEHGPYYSSLKMIGVQIAVIAMTREEATASDMAKVFDSELDKLTGVLLENGIEDFTSCYGEKNRHEWKPLIASQVSIEKIVQDVIAKLSKVQKSAIRPRYLSDDFLSSNSEERHKARKSFKQYGGVLIVDAISMYHLGLRQALLQSQLVGSNDRIAVIVVSPLNTSKVNELLEKQIYALWMEEAFSYSVHHLHPLYEFGIADIYNLRRRLFSILLNIGSSNGLSQNVRLAIQTERGGRSGIGNLVTRGF